MIADGFPRNGHVAYTEYVPAWTFANENVATDVMVIVVPLLSFTTLYVGIPTPCVEPPYPIFCDHRTNVPGENIPVVSALSTITPGVVTTCPKSRTVTGALASAMTPARRIGRRNVRIEICGYFLLF